MCNMCISSNASGSIHICLFAWFFFSSINTTLVSTSGRFPSPRVGFVLVQTIELLSMTTVKKKEKDTCVKYQKKQGIL